MTDKTKDPDEKVDKLAWLRDVRKPLRNNYREVLLVSLFVNLLALGTSVFTLQVYDRVISSASVTTLGGLVIGMLLVILFDFVLKQTRSRMMQRTALRIDAAVGRKLFNKILALPLPHLESRPNNYWTALFRDIEVVRNTLSGPSAILLTGLPFAFLYIALVVVMAWPIVPVLFIMLIAFIVTAWLGATRLSAANAAERKTAYDRDTMVAEVINGRTTVKALALDASVRPLWGEKHANNIEEAMLRGRKSDIFSNFGTVLTTLTTVVMAGAGALEIINHDLTVGALIAANMLAGRILSPFN
ncbi:MAG: hypothetical protein EXQ85_05670 [Alphaproteobacteria bacterium]|nr:hypothetical protein [Alphaproteobacteria bacterium]